MWMVAHTEGFHCPTAAEIERARSPLQFAAPAPHLRHQQRKTSTRMGATSGRHARIAERSLRTLSKSQGAGDLIRLYLFAKRDGAEFNLAAIPSSFRVKSREPFDGEYMRALFDVGFQQGRTGYRWLPAPPEISAPEEMQDQYSKLR